MKLDLKDLKIHPKVSQMAEQIDTPESYAKASEIFLQANFNEAMAIVEEGCSLLGAYLRNPQKITLDGNQRRVLIQRVQEMNEFAEALAIVNKIA